MPALGILVTESKEEMEHGLGLIHSLSNHCLHFLCWKLAPKGMGDKGAEGRAVPGLLPDVLSPGPSTVHPLWLLADTDVLETTSFPADPMETPRLNTHLILHNCMDRET